MTAPFVEAGPVRSTTLSKPIIQALFAIFYVWVFLDILHPLQDPGLWWHLAAGRQIAHLHHVPMTDTFSSTAAGTVWINSYWLYDVLLFATYHLGGFTAIILVHALAVLLLFYFVERILRAHAVHWAMRLAGLVILYKGAAPAGGYWGPEANLVTLFFVSLLLWQLDRWNREGWFSALWCWPFIFCLWANLHRGFLVGLCIAGAYVLSVPSDGKRSRRWGWFMLDALVTFITPRPLGLYHMIINDFFLSSERISGWFAPDLTHLKLFSSVVIALWVVLALNWKKEIRAWPLIFLAGLLTAGSLRHLVYVPYLMIVAVPAIAVRLSTISGLRDRIARTVLDTTLAVIFLTGAAVGIHHTRPAFGAHWSKVFDFVRDEKIQGPFYNDYMLGGMWMWAFDGRPPVFIDGRYPAVEGYIPLAKEWVAATASVTSWGQFLDRYKIQTALVQFRDNPRPSLQEVLFPRSRWALVFWDNGCALFVRRGPVNQAVVTRDEYRLVLPDAKPDYTIARLDALSPAERREFGQELWRNAQLDPTSQRSQSLIELYLAYIRSAG